MSENPPQSTEGQHQEQQLKPRGPSVVQPPTPPAPTMDETQAIQEKLRRMQELNERFAQATRQLEFKKVVSTSPEQAQKVLEESEQCIGQ